MLEIPETDTRTVPTFSVGPDGTIQNLAGRDPLLFRSSLLTKSLRNTCFTTGEKRSVGHRPFVAVCPVVNAIRNQTLPRRGAEHYMVR